jgi:predicted nicotinamide N-methyase
VSTSPLQLIERETVVSRAPLCPEIQLHLVTHTCRLWRATDRDLEALELADPFWAFAWAGGQAIARYLLDHPEEVRGRKVFDFAAGGGIQGIAAALAGASCVAANDLDPIALHAASMNADLNGVHLDLAGGDLVGDPLAEFEVVLAGDAFYGSEAPAVLKWLCRLAKAGKRVLLADAGRGFIETEGLLGLAQFETPTDEDSDGTRLRPTWVYTPNP